MEMLYDQIADVSSPKKVFSVISSCALFKTSSIESNFRVLPQALSGHENIIRLQHVIKAENDEDIYLTFDHMETGVSL